MAAEILTAGLSPDERKNDSSIYGGKAKVSFPEILYSPAVGMGDIPNDIEAGCTPAAIIRTDAMNIELSNQISESLLRRILRGIPCLRIRQGSGVWFLPAETVGLRKGIDGLAMIIGDQYGQNPFEKGRFSSSVVSDLTAVKVCFGGSYP